MDSGLAAEPVIGPRFTRTRWRHPGMMESVNYLSLIAGATFSAGAGGSAGLAPSCCAC
jgi:hypothetical protein